MTQHQRSHRRFVPTYATLVGIPALALLVILRIGDAVAGKNAVTNPATSPASAAATVLMLATLASAWITERLGVHALFGAFLVGAVAAKGEGFVGRWFLRLIGRGGD